MSPAIKHHLSSPQIRMGQGYIPKNASFRSAWRQGHTICKPFPINTCALSEQVTFGSQPRKQLHTLTPNNANFTILSAVTNIFMFTGGYEVTSCSSMEPSMATMGTPKLVTFTLKGDRMP